jgi:hypothetical protein
MEHHPKIKVGQNEPNSHQHTAKDGWWVDRKHFSIRFQFLT